MRSGAYVRLKGMAEKCGFGSVSQAVEWLLDQVDEDYIGGSGRVSLTREEAAEFSRLYGM